MSFKEITVKELKNKIDQDIEYQLIDVRELHEFQFANIGGELIPMKTVKEKLDRIKRDIPVIIMCRSGKRSADVIKMLQSDYGFENLFNLKGGILAWSDEIDPAIQKY